jgi:phage gpG-like protein
MRSLTELTREFHNSRKLFEQLTAQTPRIMGKIGVDVIRENFDAQGFVESVGPAQKWKERSPTTNKIYDSRKGYKGSVYNSSNPILRQSGNLHDGVKYIATQKRVNIGVNLNTVPYAKLMNEGGSVQFGKRWVRIPARKFLGMSQKLSLRIDAELIKKRKQAFSKFRMI